MLGSAYDRPVRPARVVAAAALALLAWAAGCDRGPRAQPIESPPGAKEFSPELSARLRQALDAEPASDAPRTRHRRADGSPRYTNRLILETSPYLLQHAHNPVNWYPWGDEAFAKARSEGKTVFVSIGYATCHWCHVMEEESFEDLEIATYLNEHYVAIKVDREERPDVDETYMAAVQLLTGNGGWPLSVWLTPARQPFFGGTYFPPRDGERGPGFLSVLHELRDAYRDHPLTVARQATELTARIERAATVARGEGAPGAAVLHRAFAQYRSSFDATYGGFGGAPKFPMPAALDFLLRYHRRAGDAAALAMVTQTLTRMAAGGIYDQVGGGFHRYATDRAWQIPHFEKMLYDNAELADVYLEAYQATGDGSFARIARETLTAVARDMTAPSGGFYAASDADSADGEGRYFVWNGAELAAALDPDQLAAVRAYYGVTAEGNFHGANVLHVAGAPADVATELGTTPAALDEVLAGARARLRAARAARPAPRVDTKILAGWNGLMISAFAHGAAALGDPDLLEHARRAAEFVMQTMWDGVRLRRSDDSPTEGFLEDYAFLAAGLLDLYDATFETDWLRDAIRLHERLAAQFWDETDGGFFLTGGGHEPLLVRWKPADAGALPSANAIAVDSLLRLAELTGKDGYRRRAAETLRAFAPAIERAPTRAPRLLGAVEFFLDQPFEIVVVSAGAADPRAQRLLEVARRRYLPNRVLVAAAEGRALARQRELIPLVESKVAIGGAATAYVCERGVCALPTGDPAVLARQLSKVRPLPPGDGGAAADADRAPSRSHEPRAAAD